MSDLIRYLLIFLGVLGFIGLWFAGIVLVNTSPQAAMVVHVALPVLGVVLVIFFVFGMTWAIFKATGRRD